MLSRNLAQKFIAHPKSMTAGAESTSRLSRRVFPCPAWPVLLLAVFLGVDSLSALEIPKLIAITSADSVRIELAPAAGESFDGVQISAEITPARGGPAIWQGPLTLTVASKPEVLTCTISGLKPDLWNPDSPTLYQLKVTAAREGRSLAAKSVRIGFRAFEIKNGQFQLNGRPIFLRGIAINPPGRTIPAAVGESRAFAEAYVRYLKSQNVNIFRLTADDSQVWFDVCDELGMLMYAGHYGSPFESDEGKKAAPKNFDKSIAAYHKLLEGFASHPSIVMYLLSNELPVSGKRGEDFSEFLTRAHRVLKSWDATRPYIGNAGYGEGREGDVCDVHRYWGWYYNSFLTYYNLRDKLYPTPLFGDPAKNQPLTFTECVGSFTGWSGEFNIIRSKQLGPQLGWIGHSSTPREDALRYQAFMVGRAAESFRRMRPLNPRLSGLMPFTILFYNWEGITNFAQMKPKPAMEQMGISYQPVLLSWELWTPQVYAGAKVRVVAHVINDSENGRALSGATLNYELRGQRADSRVKGKVQIPTIPYYGTWRQAIELELPRGLATGEYTLCGSVATAVPVSTNWTDLFIAGDDWKKASLAPKGEVTLYDPSGRTSEALKKMGVQFKKISDLSSLSMPTTLVIGEGAGDGALAARKDKLREFVRAGGRILCLRPEPGTTHQDWLPEKVSFFTSSPNASDYPPKSRPFREQMNINPERPEHPVFQGLDRRRLSLWSDYSGWDETKPGFPKIYPVTAGFKLEEQDALARTAILADYDRGLEGIALCEMFQGAGSVILCGLDLVNRCGLDPAADRLLVNLVAYATSRESHEVYPLIDKPIQWGNYPSERGAVCGSLNGLIVNAEWRTPPTDPAAKPLPPNTGSWNMEPGSQFSPRGRNPFGAYTYSTGSTLKDLDRDSETGSGVFWVSIPKGRNAMVTKVNNPTARPAQLTVALDQAAAATPCPVGAGETIEVRSPLATNTTNVCVRYTGNKSLVLLETRFE